MSNTLYTVGHSNHTPETFLGLLRLHEIAVLIDVRSAPYSRYVPHFNKSELQEYLPKQGIDYRYAGEYLGGQPKDETVYKNQQVPDAEREQFLKLVDYEAVMKKDWYLKGIRRLLEIIEQTAGSVTIMCSEGDPLDCHRHHLIARSLVDASVRIVDQNINVRHILKDGTMKLVSEADFEVHRQTPRQGRLF